jgi:hypothetical protein
LEVQSLKRAEPLALEVQEMQKIARLSQVAQKSLVNFATCPHFSHAYY